MRSNVYEARVRATGSAAGYPATGDTGRVSRSHDGYVGASAF